MSLVPATSRRRHAAWTWPVAGALLLLAFALALAAGQAPVEDEKKDEKKPAPPPARSPADDEEKDKSRRDYDADCLRSGCHARLNKTTFVHAPVAVGACASCHEPDGDAARHRFKYVREEKELCSFCHRPKEAAKFIHTAYSEGKCTGCHDAHGGKAALYLKNEDRSALCLGCHDAALAPAAEPGAPRAAFPFRHQPVTEKKCVECHQSHQSNQPNLLPVPERELCLKCHPAVLADLRAAAHVHEPVKEECSGCHAGHGGADRTLLREPAQDLCLGCHEPVLAAGHTRGDVHPPLRDGASCLDCHKAHTAASPGLVAGDVSAACYGCHAREITLDGGRKIADVKSEVAGAKFVHEPVAKGACNACHSGHASPHGDLLAKPYPEGIYADFSERAFELCFGACHDASLVTAERTTATRFRDGDRNLHAVHVNQRKSRTCALCHRAHASDLPALTRDRVPFGPHGWTLAIGFRKTETGGTCASGCHQELGYRNREPGDGAPASPAAPGDGEKK